MHEVYPSITTVKQGRPISSKTTTIYISLQHRTNKTYILTHTSRISELTFPSHNSHREVVERACPRPCPIPALLCALRCACMHAYMHTSLHEWFSPLELQCFFSWLARAWLCCFPSLSLQARQTTEPGIHPTFERASRAKKEKKEEAVRYAHDANDQYASLW